MDLDTAASKIGVHADRLRTWEAGRGQPTIIQARKMSGVYRRPLAAFFLPQRPSELGFTVPHDFRRLSHDQPRALSSELIAELRRVEYLRDAAIELAEEIPQEPKRFVRTCRLDEPPVQVARRVLELLGMGPAPRAGWKTAYDALNGWKDAIEQQGVLVMHLIRVELREVRGIAIAERTFPLVALNGKDPPYGRVFTLVHEFVHLMLGATGISNMRLSRRPRTRDQRIEQFCNQVAGEVLVPSEALRSHPYVQRAPRRLDWPDETITGLSDFFRVSREVIVRRLAVLRLTTNDFYRQKRQQYAQEREAAGPSPGGPLPMPRRILRAVGQPFARIALDAYHREAISGSDLAELLGARLKHLPAVEELLAGRNVLTGGDR